MSSSNLYHTISPALAAAARDVCYHSFAALTFLIWYAIVTSDDEVEYIWTMSNKNIFKWAYFFLRYVVILAHATHNVFIEQLANGTNHPIFCSMWFMYALGFSQGLATLLELILATRVFALYNRSRRVALLLLILILVETAGTVRLLLLQEHAHFHGTCLLIRGTAGSKYQTIFGFIIHCILISLTLIKYFFALRAGWGRTPLVSLVVRDNSTVYVTILFLIMSVATMCGLEKERAVATVFWSTSLISIMGCRMILSMERFARELSTGLPLRQQLLTSQIWWAASQIRPPDPCPGEYADTGIRGSHQHDAVPLATLDRIET